MMNGKCLFCDIEPNRVLYEDQFYFTIRDGYPVSDGHTLIVAKRHVGSFFEMENDEQNALLAILKRTKTDLDQEFSPDAYNIGINDGPAAGQTVPHLHVHLIPRYEGDVSDPKGGIRWVIPDKAEYWEGNG